MRAATRLRHCVARHAWLLAVAFVGAGVVRGASAQIPLPNPNLDLVGNGRVAAMLTQADGSLIIGGEFQSINGVPRRNLARLRADRTLDASWDPSPDRGVTALAQAADGAIYVGGYFDHIGGAGRPGVARLIATSGAVDAAWLPEANNALAIVVDATGSVFVIPSASTHRTILKLSGVDGTQLPWGAAYERVDHLMLDGHGGLYAAARSFDFDFPASTYRATITKRATASGEPDAQWSLDLPGPIDSVLEALALDGDAIYLGGSFGLRKFSAASGQEDAAWNAPDARIQAIAPDGAGHLVLGGAFESIHGQPRMHLARVSATSGLPSPGWNPSTDGAVDFIRIDANGDIDIAGWFQAVNQHQRIGLGRLLASTALAPVRTDVESSAKASVVAAQANGGMVVGGMFHRADGLARRNILRLAPDGTLDSQWSPSLPSMPWVLAAAPDGGIHAAVNRRPDATHAASVLYRIDDTGTLDPDWSVHADGWINAVSVASDGALLVGGDFSIIGGAPRRALAKVDAKSGIPLPTWDAHLDGGAVRAIEPGNGEQVFIGGTFQSVAGQAQPLLARISATNAVADAQWRPDLGEGAAIAALARDADGSLYIGGHFWSVNGTPRRHLAKLRADDQGTTVLEWHPDFCWGDAWNGLNYYVASLALDGNGTVYAGGSFCAADGMGERGLARLSGSNGLVDTDWDPLAWYAAPRSLALSQAGAIHVTGYFDQAGGLPRAGLAAFAPTLPDRLFIDGFEDRNE